MSANIRDTHKVVKAMLENRREAVMDAYATWCTRRLARRTVWT